MAYKIIYALVMLFSGLTIPVMAALNGKLGSHYESFAFASVILFAVAFFCALGTVLVTGFPRWPESDLPPHYYLGGLVVAFYVLSITFIAPRFGVANAVFFVLFGQILSSVIIEHFGLFGTTQIPLSYERVLGVVMMAGGVYLAKKMV